MEPDKVKYRGKVLSPCSRSESQLVVCAHSFQESFSAGRGLQALSRKQLLIELRLSVHNLFGNVHIGLFTHGFRDELFAVGAEHAGV